MAAKTPKIKPCWFYQRRPSTLQRELPHSAHTLSHRTCPDLCSDAVFSWLIAINKTLRYLKVADWLPRGSQDVLDEILIFSPALCHLYLSHKCFTIGFGQHIVDARKGHPLVNTDYLPLETLELDGEDIDYDRDDPNLDITPRGM